MSLGTGHLQPNSRSDMVFKCVKIDRRYERSRSQPRGKTKRDLAARLRCGSFFLGVPAWGGLEAIKYCPEAPETRLHIFSCRQMLTACKHIYSQIFFLSLHFLSFLHQPPSAFDTSSRVDFNVNSLLGLVTNGKLAIPRHFPLAFYYDEHRCRPYHTKPW